MLFVSLLDYNQNLENIACDGFELRLDAFSSLDKDQISVFCNKLKKPLIFTLRKKSQGGFYSKNEKERLAALENLLTLNPEYVDIEYDTDPGFIKKIHQEFPQIKIILSYHNFQKTPQNLASLLKSFILPEVFAYKIATYANSTLDALKMILFVKENSSSYKLIGLCMGENGEATRLVSPITKNFIDYASLNEKSIAAEGQLPLQELLTIYHYKSLNSNTLLFGLIGDPVKQSISSYTHNLMFVHHRVNALYLKLKLTPEELNEGLLLIKQCGFSGVSVTTPLKELIYPLMDKVIYPANEIKAINTIKIENDSFIGYNTDGIGCIEALESKTPIINKKILILGAGGAAKAIAFTANAQKADVYIYNRTYSKALDFIKDLNLKETHAVSNLKHFYYDILINATSSLNPIDLEYMLNQTYVMDISVRPKMTPFLLETQKKKCLLIYGYEMFAYQALDQFKIWLNQNFDKKYLLDACVKQL